MLALRVVDQRHRRRGERGERGDLARMVHAELDHRGAVGGAQAEQGQRHADMVVEVAGGRMGGVAEPGAQQRGGHLGDGGLAVAAGDGDQLAFMAPAPGGGERLQRGQRIVDLQPGQAGVR